MKTKKQFAGRTSVLLLALFLGFTHPAMAGGPEGTWVLYEALQYSEGNFYHFDNRVDYLTGHGGVALLSRAISGVKPLPAKIERTKQGRNYQKDLYYTVFEEARKTSQGWSICSMKVYYHPESKAIDSIVRTGDCADDPLPEVPGITFRPVAPSSENPD